MKEEVLSVDGMQIVGCVKPASLLDDHQECRPGVTSGRLGCCCERTSVQQADMFWLLCAGHGLLLLARRGSVLRNCWQQSCMA